MNFKYHIKSDTLWLTTLGFLALPVGIFAVGWLKPIWVVLVIICLAAGIIFRAKPSEESPTTVSQMNLILLAAGCIAICLLAGVGGFSYQDGDYFKHNAILADLYRREWPVAYSIEHGGSKHPAALVYYIAYYLPPALIGKIAGWEAMRYAILLWTACGLFIVSLWCLKFTRGALWAPLAFLAFGGFDIFGMILGIKFWHWMPELWMEHRQMEWWAGFSFGNYLSNSNHLFWAPQHALPGWLITAAVLHRIRSGTLEGCLFLAALTPLWSPFVSLGLLPIGLAGLLVTRGKGTFTGSNMAAIPLLILSGAFYAARGVPGLPFLPVPFSWNDVVPLKLAATFILEVLPWTLLALIPFRSTSKADRIVIVSCVIFLAILPLWRVGTFNDLMMKASLPAFSVLAFLILRKAVGSTLLWKKVALVTLVAGSGGLAFDIYRHVEFSGNRSEQIDFTSPEKIPILPETPDLVGLLDQYLGAPQTVFFRKLARPLPSVGESTVYNQEAPPPGAIESQNRLQRKLRRRFEKGDRSPSFLQEFSTLCFYQGDLWESMLVMEAMIERDPGDPNARVNLATLLSMSGIEAFRERARSELNTARSLTQDPAGFDRATESLRQSLQPSQ